MKDNKILNEDMKYISEKFGKQDVFNNKRILITGCAGFLGYYFTNYFLYLMKNGCKIKSLVLLDNFIIRKPDWIKDIEAKEKHVELHTFDISKDKLASINSAKEADYVIHMASIASPTFYRQFPLETVDANIWGLRNLLDFY